eukprot:7635332-Alexandrium_andersonii.AAC.1
MSASLVGSEMCIRDRRTTARNRSADAVPGEVLPPGARLVSLVGECCSPCLLYTSDAADDM